MKKNLFLLFLVKNESFKSIKHIVENFILIIFFIKHIVQNKIRIKIQNQIIKFNVFNRSSYLTIL